jgi:hypothetical protein
LIAANHKSECAVFGLRAKTKSSSNEADPNVEVAACSLALNRANSTIKLARPSTNAIETSDTVNSHRGLGSLLFARDRRLGTVIDRR